MKKYNLYTLILILVLLLASSIPSLTIAQQRAQYELSWSTVADGGLSSDGNENGYTLFDSIGQPVSDVMQGDGYALSSGFLSGSLTIDNLVLLYVNLDNDLARFSTELFREIHAGATQTDGIVLMVFDGPKDDDSRLYRVTGGREQDCLDILDDYTCGGKYIDGHNVKDFSENLGDPEILEKFVVDAVQDYPTSQNIILSLIGHGGGWSPNLLAGQPKQIGGQPGELGGLLWDYHSRKGATEGQALSTDDLGEALREVKSRTGRSIDLLYLDACLMAMWEVVYELKDTANYLLASESWSWTSFQYQEHLSAVTKGVSIQDVGDAWAKNEIEFLKENYDTAYTYSLIDTSLIVQLSDEINILAETLINAPITQNELRDVFFATDRFDSTQDGAFEIDGKDNYADLGNLMQVLQQKFPNNLSIVDATNSIQESLKSVVVSKYNNSGYLPAPYPDNLWEWQDPSGLSIYLPLNPDEDDWKRRYYNKLASSEDGLWDEFINNYWGEGFAPEPDCANSCEIPPASLFVESSDVEPPNAIYVPIVQR